MKLIFDTETNGLTPGAGVLSFSALLVSDKNEIIEQVDRYYFRPPGVSPGEEALAVNGLYDDEIDRRRAGADYPRYFGDDDYIPRLFSRADLLIAHNIFFDLGHVKNAHKIEEKPLFCTMESTKWLYDYPCLKNGEPKWPKLSEAAAHFEIDLKEIAEKTGLDFHDSLFDVYVTFEVYKRLEELGPEAVHEGRRRFFKKKAKGRA